MVAKNFVWTGNDGTTSWTDAKNWVNAATNQVAAAAPGGHSSDTATINGGASNYPTLSSKVALASVTINADGGLTVGTGGSLVASASDASAISNAGVITLSGGKMVASAGGITNTGVIDATATSSIRIGSADALANTGQIDVSGGVLTVKGPLDNASTGAIDLAGNGSLKVVGHALTNAGSIAVAGGSITDATDLVNNGTISGFGVIAAPVDANSNGTIEATGGKLTLSSAVNGGALEIGSASADNLVLRAASSVSGVTFASATGAGTMTVDADVTVTGANLAIGSNNLVLNSALSDAAGLSLAGGKISGSGGISGGTNITGYGVVAVAITGNETIAASGGTLTLSGLVDHSGAPTSFDIANGATLAFSNSGTVGSATIEPSLTFGAGSGTFIDTAAGAGAVHLGTITGFSGTDQIELKAFGSSDKFTISGNTLTISGGSKTESFTFSASTDVQHLKVADSSGVDTITICFMAGTMISTPAGERAIETLKRGDLVLTTDGVAKKVCWLGRQTVSSIFADPVRSWPIRIKAGALGENIPSRDLLLSPDHAVLIEGALIHAGALVNGSSILRETRVPRSFIYYHVELDDHSLIFAENTPAETFIDNAERLAFDNWDEHQKLYPAGTDIEELPYPRAKAPRQVPVRIRIMLAKNAQFLGHAVGAATS